MPFGEAGKGEFGTYFIGYSRSPRTIEQMLENMFVGKPPGNYDRILDFSRAVTGNLFFAPTAAFLENVSRRSAAAGRSHSGRCPATHPVGARWFAWHRLAQREAYEMNNLHRELAPVSEMAWAQIEEEASRTLKRYLAGRRVVDVEGPGGTTLSAVGTGHLRNIAAPADGVLARQREVKPLIELRVPFELDRQMIDDVERGANDSDWQPVKDAAKKIAFAEDAAIFDGYDAGNIEGIRQGTSNPVVTLPADVRNYPERDRACADRAAPRRGQRPLLGAAGRRRLYRGQRGRRLRLSDHCSTSSGWSRPRSSGPRRSPGVCADHPRRRFRHCISARISRSAISPTPTTPCASICRKPSPSCS